MFSGRSIEQGRNQDGTKIKEDTNNQDVTPEGREDAFNEVSDKESYSAKASSFLSKFLSILSYWLRILTFIMHRVLKCTYNKLFLLVSREILNILGISRILIFGYKSLA